VREQFWRRAACAHLQTSAPDEMGDAICADCGASVRVVLTQAAFMDTIDSVYRGFGGGRRHSKRCVRLEGGGFLCADDCRVRA
jgi:hypothetical protein